MAIAEDVRNLFREFEGRAEGYIEFDPGQAAGRTAPPGDPAQFTSGNGGYGPIGGNGTNGRHGADAAPAAPVIEVPSPPATRPLDQVFARIARRPG